MLPLPAAPDPVVPVLPPLVTPESLLGPVEPESTTAESTTPEEPSSCSRYPEGSVTIKPIIPATGEEVHTERDYTGGDPQAMKFVRYFRSSWSVGAARGLTSTPGLGQSWGHNHAVSLVIGGAKSNFARVLWGDGSVSGFAWESSSASWKAVNGADTLAPVTSGAGGLVLARAQDDSKWLFDPSGRLSTVTS